MEEEKGICREIDLGKRERQKMKILKELERHNSENERQRKEININEIK